MSQPVLLVGAGGQLGSELAVRLRELGPVTAAARADADLTDPFAVRELVRRVRPGLIVNAAAYTAVDAAERDEAACFAVNAEAPRILAEEGARLGAGIVHFSTNYVFDGAKREPYTESDPMSPLNVYGLSKAAGEEGVARSNPAHLILRTAAVYGWSGRNFLRRVLDLAAEREELQMVSDQFVSPTPAPEAARATVRVLRGLADGTIAGPMAGTFHLSCGGGVSWFGFAERILALARERDGRSVPRLTPVSSMEYRSAAARPLNGVLDNAGFARRFGFALPSWEDALVAAFEGQAQRT